MNSPPTKGRRWVRRTLIVTLVAFVGIQFVPVERTNAPVDSARTINSVLHPPADVAKLMSDACDDCHSDSTRWPAYSWVAPASWLIAYDVHHAREHMNLSRFGVEVVEDQAAVLDDAAEQVRSEEMPLPRYKLMHPPARLSNADRQKLAAWFETTSRSLRGGSPQSKPSDHHEHTHEHR